MTENFETFEGIIQRSHSLERNEDKKVIEESEPVDEGDTKEVYRGLRHEFITEEETNQELRQIFRDLSRAERVVNTWIYTHDGLDMIKKDEIPHRFQTVLQEHGAEYAVKEAVEVFENIADHGYVYCDLAPENIRFNYDGKAIAIDYLDEEATEPLDEVDTTFAAAMSYDLFTRELSSEIPDLDAEEIEEHIDTYSNHVEAEEYTGEPLTDFADPF